MKAGGYREISAVFSVSDKTEPHIRGLAGGARLQMTAQQIIKEQKLYRRELEEQSGFLSDTAKCLAKSASQFIAKRESTGGDTILAGFPFFEDWGRDTMIALPGYACLHGGMMRRGRS